MTKIRPYMAIDIETTGLDVERVHILQLGWVIDDGVSPRDQLKRGSIIIKEEVITYGESFALGMNGWLFQEMSKKEPKYPVMSLCEGLDLFMIAIEKTSAIAYEFDVSQGEKRPSSRVQMAGKNVGPFDFAILKRVILQNYNVLLKNMNSKTQSEKWFSKFVDHRFIDCGAIFFEDFGRNPGFDKICKLIGHPEINHDALADAESVVVACRYKAGILT